MSKREELWNVVKIGRPAAFSSPQEMWDRAVEYFNWCKANVITEQKAFSFQGEITIAEVEHARAMTQAGLCAHLNIGVSTWHDYKSKPDYSEVIKAIELIMYEQKFTGAASGQFNANIIARDLGLQDATKVDNVSSDGSMSPAGTLKVTISRPKEK